MDDLRLRDATRALTTLVVLAVVVGAVYGRTLGAPFIFDDVPGIVENPSLVRLWPPIGDAAHPGPLRAPPLAPTARRPLANLTLALNHRFAGLDPAPYRATNLVLHVLAAVTLAAIVRRTLLLPYFADAWVDVAWPLSLAIAVAWAVHPLATEAVAYVTQRTELLGALFYLLALWAAVRHWTATSRASRAAWLVGAVLAGLAGMASKEIVASVPVIVLLYERTFLVRSMRETRRSWPLHVGLALGWVLLVLVSAGGIGGLSDPRHHVAPVVWWMTQAKVLLLYLKLVVWPSPLSIHYAPTYLTTLGAAWPWLAGVALVAAVAAAIAWRRPAVALVLVAVLGVLAPTLVVPLAKMIAAERRMYLPLAGLVILAGVGGVRALGSRLGAALATLLVVAWSAVSVARLETYRSAVSIWADAVRHQPEDAMAHYNLGVALAEARSPADALPQFEEALRLDPEHGGALDNLGRVLIDLGRPEDALAPLERALALDPDDAIARNNLGAALLVLGRPGEALGHLERALVDEPDRPKGKVHLNLGRALLDLGRPGDAVAHLVQAVDADPGDADAHDALGSALLKDGHPESALAEYRRALVLAPGRPGVHNNLGTALLALGRTDDAIGELEAAVRANPDHVEARYNLASALLQANRPGDAVGHFERVVRLRPDDAEARFGCALAYARTSRSADAAAMAAEAVAAARAKGDGALADRIAAWLGSLRRGQAN